MRKIVDTSKVLGRKGHDTLATQVRRVMVGPIGRNGRPGGPMGCLVRRALRRRVDRRADSHIAEPASPSTVPPNTPEQSRPARS